MGPFSYPNLPDFKVKFTQNKETDKYLYQSVNVNLYNGEGTRIGLTNFIMYAQKEGDNIKLTGYKRFYFDGPWGGKRSCQSELLNLDYLEGFTFEMLTSIGSASMFEFAKDGKTYSESMDQCTSFSDWQEMIQDVKSADLQLSTWVKDLRDYFTTEYSVNVKLDDSTDDTTGKTMQSQNK